MESILRFIFVKCLGFEEIKPDPSCQCCPNELREGYRCICKEEQVIEFADGTTEKYYTQLTCDDWDCSWCH